MNSQHVVPFEPHHPAQTSNHQARLLLASLLENFCQFYERDADQSHQLYFTICRALHAMGIMDAEWMDEMAGVRKGYKRAFAELITQAMQAIRDDEPLLLTQDNSSSSWESIAEVDAKTAFLISSRYKDDFVQLKSIGRGAYGSIYHVKHLLDGRDYAVKKIHLRHASAKMLREVKAMGKLEHEHVVRYYSSWIEHATTIEPLDHCDDEWTVETVEEEESTFVLVLYIQMQLYPSTLAHYIQQRNQHINLHHVDTTASLQLFSHILKGVEYMHKSGILHRDLKPSNIFLDCLHPIDWSHCAQTQQVQHLICKIGDFGLATGDVLEDTGVDTDEDVGTALYTPPHDTTLSYHSDVYALGIILLELFHPFRTQMERVTVLSTLRNEHVLPDALLKQCPQVAAMILWMTCTDAHARPSSSEVLEWCEQQHRQYPDQTSELQAEIARLKEIMQACSHCNQFV